MVVQAVGYGGEFLAIQTLFSQLRLYFNWSRFCPKWILSQGKEPPGTGSLFSSSVS